MRNIVQEQEQTQRMAALRQEWQASRRGGNGKQMERVVGGNRMTATTVAPTEMGVVRVSSRPMSDREANIEQGPPKPEPFDAARQQLSQGEEVMRRRELARAAHPPEIRKFSPMPACKAFMGIPRRTNDLDQMVWCMGKACPSFTKEHACLSGHLVEVPVIVERYQPTAAQWEKLPEEEKAFGYIDTAYENMIRAEANRLGAEEHAAAEAARAKEEEESWALFLKAKGITA